MSTKIVSYLMAWSMMCPVILLAQGGTAVPFLVITSSVEANGMGGIAGTTSTRNPMATLSNPARLGLFSLDNYVAVSRYTPKTAWLPGISNANLSIDVSAIAAGLNFSRVLAIPLPLSFGLSYSRVFLDRGSFARTGEGGPDPVYVHDAHEKFDAITMGIGINAIVRMGTGITVKRIVSRLGTAEARATAADWGVIIQIPSTPLVRVLSADFQSPFRWALPFVDVTLGYATNNIGGTMIYIDPSQADPLPRKALMGMAWELGLQSTRLERNWTLGSITIAREAEDILVTRFSDGGFAYQKGSGDLRFFRNVVMGQWGGKVTVRKGWQLNLAEAVYIRGGSVVMPGLEYSTGGFGFSLRGFFNLIEAMSPGTIENSALAFVFRHLDIQYDQSSYGNTESPIRGTRFRGLNLSLR